MASGESEKNEAMIELVLHLLKTIARALLQCVTRLQGGDKWRHKRVTFWSVTKLMQRWIGN